MMVVTVIFLVLVILNQNTSKTMLVCWFVGLLVCLLVCWLVGLFVCLFFPEDLQLVKSATSCSSGNSNEQSQGTSVPFPFQLRLRKDDVLAFL